MITISNASLAAFIRAAMRESGAEVVQALTHHGHPWWMMELERHAKASRDVAADFVAQAFDTLDVPSDLLVYQFPRHEEICLLGRGPGATRAFERLRAADFRVSLRPWSYLDRPPTTAELTAAHIVVCDTPRDARDWSTVRDLRRQFGKRLRPLWSLLLPLGVIHQAQAALPYYHNDLEGLAQSYCAPASLPFVAALAALVPLAGKRVIEFGTLEFGQTAQLAALGPSEVLTVEARPENVIKSLIGMFVGGFRNVTIVMDNFHNVASDNYGTFDLVFAHGVYYHSNAPFLFFENLISLAPAIFVGGFCATDARPHGAWMTLSDQGQDYRVKSMFEGNESTAGLQANSIVFEGTSLLRYFECRGYRIDILERVDVTDNLAGGEYLRFLARRN